MKMQSIPREQCNTYRGMTGHLHEQFNKQKMGMDFAFFSTTTEKRVAIEFALKDGLGGKSEYWVLFEVAYLAACPGVDVKYLSVYPGENEVLFPPCTALNKVDDGSKTTTGEIKVSPVAAQNAG